MSPARVAISQPVIVSGGRLQVILGIVRVLNQMGITPDLIPFRVTFDPNKLRERYGQSVQFNLRPIPAYYPTHRFPDLDVIAYHARLGAAVRGYDLVINSSNSLLFLPPRARVLSYVHFPREYQILFSQADVRRPELRYFALDPRRMEHLLARWFYRFRRLRPGHGIVCNSEYTRRSLAAAYPIDHMRVPVIYPNVDMAQFRAVQGGERRKQVVSLARFAPDKRQLEQIALARRMPDVPFYIGGFVHKQKYFNRCQADLESRPAANVHLWPNLPFADLLALFAESKYFLHALINEPFGITSVQAVMAGCLPLVHDSGGQRETVPLPELRYQALDEVPAMIERLERQGETYRRALVRQLQEHALSNFDQPVFTGRMRAALETMLAGTP